MITKDASLCRVRAWDEHGREVSPEKPSPWPRPDNIITRRVDAAAARRKNPR